MRGAKGVLFAPFQTKKKKIEEVTRTMIGVRIAAFVQLNFLKILLPTTIRRIVMRPVHVENCPMNML